MINENDEIFQVQKSPSQVYGSKVARNLSRVPLNPKKNALTI